MRHYITSTGIEVRLDWSTVPRALLLVHFEDWIFAFFQSSGTSPDVHDFPKVITSGFNMVSLSAFVNASCQGPWTCAFGFV